MWPTAKVELMIDPPNVKVTCEEMTRSYLIEFNGSEDLSCAYHHFLLTLARL